VKDHVAFFLIEFSLSPADLIDGSSLHHPISAYPHLATTVLSPKIAVFATVRSEEGAKEKKEASFQ
jgi:hypothetical protein